MNALLKLCGVLEESYHGIRWLYISGHGFKLAPVIGVMLSELVLKEKPTYRVKQFDADRFIRAKL